MKLLTLACSLSPRSHSFVLAQHLTRAWAGGEAELVDLRETPLELCAGGGPQGSVDTDLIRRIEAADALALAVPIYNYDVGGAARNLIAVTGAAWRDKVVGLLGAAGGERSYMSMMSVAGSLMLDFRCLVVPRFVYASRASFTAGELVDVEIQGRIEVLAGELQRISGALAETGPGLAG